MTTIKQLGQLIYCMTGDSGEVVDKILGPFLQECIGKNDMAVVSGLLTSAAILLVTHYENTGDDIQELATMCRENFDLALEIHKERGT